MKKILIINASAREITSQSRSLSRYFTDYLDKISVPKKVLYRDLANCEIPHITQSWIDADTKSSNQRTESEREILKLSDQYLKELHESDIIVLATPMYNWSIPSSLKAYIDQIMRVDKAFSLNPEKGSQRYLGLFKEKKMILLLSRGSHGYEPGERNEYMNFQNTYLKFVFGIMGIKNIQEITVNGTSKNDDELKMEVKKAQNQIQSLIEKELLYVK